MAGISLPLVWAGALLLLVPWNCCCFTTWRLSSPSAASEADLGSQHRHCCPSSPESTAPESQNGRGSGAECSCTTTVAPLVSAVSAGQTDLLVVPLLNGPEDALVKDASLNSPVEEVAPSGPSFRIWHCVWQC